MKTKKTSKKAATKKAAKSLQLQKNKKIVYLPRFLKYRKDKELPEFLIAQIALDNKHSTHSIISRVLRSHGFTRKNSKTIWPSTIARYLGTRWDQQPENK